MPLCTALSLKTKRRASFPGGIKQTEEMDGKVRRPGRTERVDCIGKPLLEESEFEVFQNPGATRHRLYVMMQSRMPPRFSPSPSPPQRTYGPPRPPSPGHQEKKQLAPLMQPEPHDPCVGCRLHASLPPRKRHLERSTTFVCSENQKVQSLQHMHLLHGQSFVKHWHWWKVIWKRKPGYPMLQPSPHFLEPTKRACG